MTTTRNIGQALGLRCSGRTDSGPCPVCGDPGFMAQNRAGRTLVTGHAGGNPNHARAALPKQGPWGSTAEPDRASPAPSRSVCNLGTDVESKQHAELTLGRKAVPAPAAPPPDRNTSDPAVRQRGLALVNCGGTGVQPHF
jgi:hypothetical protein